MNTNFLEVNHHFFERKLPGKADTPGGASHSGKRDGPPRRGHQPGGGEKKVMTKVLEGVVPYALISESSENFERPTVESPETNQAGGAPEAQRGTKVRGFWAKGSVIRDMPPLTIPNIKYLVCVNTAFLSIKYVLTLSIIT